MNTTITSTASLSLVWAAFSSEGNVSPAPRLSTTYRATSPRSFEFSSVTIRFQLTSRSEFERLAKTDPTTLTDLERSARFLYLQRTAFGGKVNGISFGVSPDRPARFNLSTLEPMLEAVFERLSGITIEALDYSTIIKRYGRPGTLFYLDPPYWGCEDDYGKAVFSREDFDTLAGLLRGIRPVPQHLPPIAASSSRERVRRCG